MEIEFIGKEELFAKLKISKSTYANVMDKENDQYIHDFPKPVQLFTSNKLRWSSVDVNNFILKYSHTSASNDNKSSAA